MYKVLKITMMKNRILLLSVLTIFFTMVFISCSDDDDKELLRLDKESVLIDAKGGAESVNLVANQLWEITNIPDWISVNPQAGENSTEVTISVVTENTEAERREASLLFTSGNLSKTLKVEQEGLNDLDPLIKLSKNEIYISITGQEQKVDLKANTSWQVKNVPNWITIDPMSGDKSAEISIKVGENRNLEAREAKVDIVAGNLKETLTISQPGLMDVIWSPSLPIFSFEEIKFNGGLTDFNIQATNIFVNPGIKDKIYLGNLVSHNPTSHTNIPEFTGYTFNPVTVSTNAPVSGEISKIYVPSWTDQDTFAKEIVAKNPQQIEGMVTDNGTIEFYNYKRLYTIGITNLGVKLDELVSGASYTEREMPNKYGLIFSFKLNLFSLTMDIPTKLIKEELKQEDKTKGVSYVSSVKYGKVGLLVVEFDSDIQATKDAILKALSDKSLTAAETNLIKSANISYVYFNNNNEARLKRGGMDAINEYKDALSDRKNIYPVGFNMANFDDNSLQTISFSFQVAD